MLSSEFPPLLVLPPWVTASMLFVHACVLAIRLRIQGISPVLKDVCSSSVNCTVVTDHSYDVLLYMTSGEASQGLPLIASPKSVQAISGIESSALITDKSSLAALSTALQWPFHPETASNPSRDAAPLDDLFLWVSKDTPHREVDVLEHLPQGLANREDGPLVQRRVVDPLLIDGTAFDLGVYAIVIQPSDGPIRLQVFEDDVLLRFCKAPFLSVKQALYFLRAAADPATALKQLNAAWLVGADYRSAWDMPSLSNLLVNATKYTTSKDALAEILRSHYRKETWENLWLQLHSIIGRVTSVFSALKPTEAKRDATIKFELVRWDG